MRVIGWKVTLAITSSLMVSSATEMIRGSLPILPTLLQQRSTVRMTLKSPGCGMVGGRRTWPGLVTYNGRDGGPASAGRIKQFVVCGGAAAKSVEGWRDINQPPPESRAEALRWTRLFPVSHATM